MKNLLRLTTIALIATFTSCVNSDDYKVPDLSGNCSDLTATRNTLDVLASATTTLQQFGDDFDDDIIEAIVTSSDEGGNFYKSISLISVDGTKGFSMPIDDYNLYTKYEPGRKVFINLKKKFYKRNTLTATVDIGEAFGTNVGRISGVVYQDMIKRSCENVGEANIVNNMTISQAKNNNNINKLIEFDNVQFKDESVGKKYYDPTLNNIGGSTNHTITDEAGNTIIVRVSQYANFSQNAVPSKNGKIRGILTKFNNDYQFMIRTLFDVNLTNPRIVPIFEESFSTNFNSWTKFSVTGAQVWTLDTQFGNPGACAKMSGFANSTNNANEDWLISPNINLTGITTAKLSFETASRFAGNLLTVFVSTNYVSGAPSTATWTPLTGFALDTNTGSYIWTNSGDINITAYTGGNFRVAFKYTSTTSASSTWEVDNVKIK